VPDPRTLPVLVVDDTPMIVVIVRAVLSKLGFHDVDEAVDGADALARLRQRSYGLVICDWNMVPMTGYKLLRIMRADEALRDVPFVMMTTPQYAQNFMAAGRTGVDACLVKPFSAAALRDTIQSICAEDRLSRSGSKKASL
jgi:two-component system chemotaxis response regulator CheY